MEIKEEAKLLRRNGLTHREIAQKLGASWSIVWLWTKGMALTSGQKEDARKRKYNQTFSEERRQRMSRLARIHLARYWKKPYSEEELIAKIRKFYLENRRIPLKGEFNMYEEYRQRFGSWNNAIKLAGFEPNRVIFSKKFVANDGHICDSFAEKIIDDWLDKNDIKHERNVPYANSKMTADFAIGNIRVEYFGLQGLNKIYDEVIKRKQKICQEANLKLIEIYPSNLFSRKFKNCLGNILKEIRG